VLKDTDTTKATRAGWLPRVVVRAAAAAVLALYPSGCVATADVAAEPVYGYPTVWVEAPPPEIESYPRYYYRGSYAYLVGDQWYYDSPRGWVIFRSEPRELAERRVYIVRQPRHVRPHYERRVPASPQEPVERGRRYYPR